MKKYIAPEFKVAMFHKETVSTDGDVMTVSQLPLQNNTAKFMAEQSADTATVQKSINFKNAIQFK